MPLTPNGKNGYTKTNTIKIYTALLTQAGTDPPADTVLENTFGASIVWTYGDVGYYIGTLTGAFTLNKVFVNGYIAQVRRFLEVAANYNENYIELFTYLDGVAANDVFGTQNNVGYIEIRVYP